MTRVPNLLPSKFFAWEEVIHADCVSVSDSSDSEQLTALWQKAGRALLLPLYLSPPHGRHPFLVLKATIRTVSSEQHEASFVLQLQAWAL